MNVEKMMNSKMYQVFDYIVRLIILNVLIFLVSLPLFTILAAFSSGFSVIRKMDENRGSGVFKEFFRFFFRVLAKTAILSLVLLIFFLLLANSIVFFFQSLGEGTIHAIGLLLSVSTGITVLACLNHLPIVISYFPDLLIGDSLKLSFLFGFKHPLLTVQLMGPTLVFLAMVAGFYQAVAFLGISLPLYLGYKMSVRTYRTIYERNKGENE